MQLFFLFFTQRSNVPDRPYVNGCLSPLKQWEKAWEQPTQKTYNPSAFKLLDIFHIQIQESLKEINGKATFCCSVLAPAQEQHSSQRCWWLQYLVPGEGWGGFELYTNRYFVDVSYTSCSIPTLQVYRQLHTQRHWTSWLLSEVSVNNYLCFLPQLHF